MLYSIVWHSIYIAALAGITIAYLFARRHLHRVSSSGPQEVRRKACLKAIDKNIKAHESVCAAATKVESRDPNMG